MNFVDYLLDAKNNKIPPIVLHNNISYLYI